jgi:hypothetical protein
MFADPSKLTPPIFLAVSSAVAVAALPVQDPDEPDALPVTLPVNAPTKVVAVVTPVKNPSPSGLSVIPLPTRTPDLAVTTPIESTFVTSSYVNTPPIVTLPLNVPVAPLTALTVILGVPVNPADVPVVF